MGCDIHLHVEVKINGKWEHYNAPYIHRHYRLFARMARVRKSDDLSDGECFKPRGIPTDVSTTTKFAYERWGVDAHDASWLGAVEAGCIQEWYHSDEKNDNPHPPLFGYVFGNDIDTYVRFPKDGNRIRSLGFEDARIVFWFDN